MILTTTNTIEGREITEYVDIVYGEAILGANFFKDFFAGIRDIIGGRSGQYEKSVGKAREIAKKEMMQDAQRLGADAVIGIDFDYETIQVQDGGSLLMVSVNGTAVKLA